MGFFELYSIFSSVFIIFLYMYMKNLITLIKFEKEIKNDIYEYSVYYKDIVSKFQNRNIVLDEKMINFLLDETRDYSEFLSNIRINSEKKNE